MARKEHKINEFKRLYLACSNSEKESILSEAVTKLNALTVIPKSEGVAKDE